MANFPITHTNRTLPSGGYTPIQTGAEAVGRGAQRLGSTIFQVGAEYYERQRDVQRAFGEAEAKRIIAAAHQKMAQTVDETQYQDIFNAAWGEVQALGDNMSNPAARSRWNQSIQSALPDQQGYVDRQVMRRIEDKEAAILSNVVAEAEINGNMGPLTTIVQSQVQAGRLSAERGDLILTEAGQKAEAALHRQAQQRIATDVGMDGASWIERNSNPAEFAANYPDSIPTDFAWATGLAKSALAQSEAERRERAAQFEMDMTNTMLSGNTIVQGEDGATISAEQAIIDNPDISPATKRTLVSLHRAVVKSYSKAEEYDELEKITAWTAIQSEADPKERLSLVAEHAYGLGWEALKPIVNDIYKQTGTNNTTPAKLVKDSIGDLSYLRRTALGTQELSQEELEAANITINTELALKESQLLKWLRQNSDKTEEEQIEHIEKALTPIIKKEAGKIVLESPLKRFNPSKLPRAQGGVFGSPIYHPAGKSVRMLGPDGKIYEFDAKYADEARKNGYKDMR